MIIGVDIDGILANYEDGLAKTIAHHLSIPRSSIPPATDWDFSDWPGIMGSRTAFLAIHNRAVLGGLLSELEPIPFSQEGLSLLSRRHRIRIITHRLIEGVNHNAVYLDTVNWLGRHNYTFDELCFVQNKADIAVDLLIDDAPHNHPDVCLATGYNRHATCPRFDSWIDIASYILELPE